jgi:uncharacterized protein YqhQ
MRPSGIGGQAVLEGVMMKNENKCAVAVRKPNGDIVVNIQVDSDTPRPAILKWPVIRGIVAFIDSMTVGIKMLTFRASLLEETSDETDSVSEESGVASAPVKPSFFKSQQFADILTVGLAVLLAVGIFMLLPYFLSELIVGLTDSRILMSLAEGVIRIVLFLGYIALISRLPDIKRVFMYHGAEHKVINCIENGFTLTKEHAAVQPRLHKRCGTSFLLDVVFLSIIFFLFISADNLPLRLLLRLVLIPVIAGVAYEWIKYAGRHENALTSLLSRPGMWLQKLTTKEPTLDMLEVAIESVEAVFDWKTFLAAKTAKRSAWDRTPSDLGLTLPKVGSGKEQDDILKSLDRYLVEDGTVDESEDGVSDNSEDSVADNLEDSVADNLEYGTAGNSEDDGNV